MVGVRSFGGAKAGPGQSCRFPGGDGGRKARYPESTNAPSLLMIQIGHWLRQRPRRASLPVRLLIPSAWNSQVHDETGMVRRPQTRGRLVGRLVADEMNVRDGIDAP